MRRVATIGLAILLGCSSALFAADEVAVANSTSPVGIKWQEDYVAAHRSRIKDKRPMLVFVTMDGCLYCEQMKHLVYSQQKIAADIKKSFIPTLVNGSRDEALADRFAVRIFPTTFLISPENKIEARLEGFVSPEELTKHISEATERYATVARKQSR